MILARHADALFWVGRYVERAEATVRCLNYAANSIIHMRFDEARVEGEQLVRTLGLEAELEEIGSLESPPQLVAFLLSDTDNPGSVVSSIMAVRENLRSTRDRIPIELWEEANGLYLRFPFLGHARTPPGGLPEVLLMVRRACLAISGVVNEGMRRDEGYEFIVVGRMLERSIFTLGLLIASYTDPRGTMDATRMLRLTSSLQAFHRQHGHDPDPEGVVHYLLHAPRLPRSVLSCLVRTQECLDHLGAYSAALDRSRRRAGLLRARLELGDVEADMESGPAPALSRLSTELVGLAGEVQAAAAQPLSAPALQAQFIRPGQGTPHGTGQGTPHGTGQEAAHCTGQEAAHCTGQGAAHGASGGRSGQGAVHGSVVYDGAVGDTQTQFIRPGGGAPAQSGPPAGGQGLR